MRSRLASAVVLFPNLAWACDQPQRAARSMAYMVRVAHASPIASQTTAQADKRVASLALGLCPAILWLPLCSVGPPLRGSCRPHPQSDNDVRCPRQYRPSRSGAQSVGNPLRQQYVGVMQAVERAVHDAVSLICCRPSVPKCLALLVLISLPPAVSVGLGGAGVRLPRSLGPPRRAACLAASGAALAWGAPGGLRDAGPGCRR